MRWMLYGWVVMIALASCTPAPPPPLPAAQAAKGVDSASITLPAQGAALKAKVHASSSAEVAPGGWIELHVYANERECIWDQVVRQPSMGDKFSTSLHCEVEVPASMPFTFRAVQKDKDAKTTAVEIEANYVR